MSVNKAMVGNLGRDPEIRALSSGQSVANFQSPPQRDSRIATASSRSTPNGFV
jgi:single-stranded DNA-binding protein